MTSHPGNKRFRSAFSNKDCVQDVENETGSTIAVEECLRNPLIVRKIFQHASCTELLQISLVNKLWKYEARTLVRKRGNLIVRLDKTNRDSRYDTCRRAQAFVLELQKMSDIPVSGISIENRFDRHKCVSPTPALLLPVHKMNIDHLALRNISLNMSGYRPAFTDCPAFVLAKKLLQQFCPVLDELSLDIRTSPKNFFENFIQDCNFRTLKTLKVYWISYDGPIMRLFEDSEKAIKVLVSRAPNLKMLKTNWTINSTLEFLQSLQRTSVEFLYTDPVSAPFDEIPENCISKIRLDRLDFKYTGSGLNYERHNRIAPMLLQSPCATTSEHWADEHRFCDASGIYRMTNEQR